MQVIELRGAGASCARRPAQTAIQRHQTPSAANPTGYDRPATVRTGPKYSTPFSWSCNQPSAYWMQQTDF